MPLEDRTCSARITPGTLAPCVRHTGLPATSNYLLTPADEEEHEVVMDGDDIDVDYSGGWQGGCNQLA